MPRNVLGGTLNCCCQSPKTGFYRDGFCQTGPDDLGRHLVCAQVTDAFLAFSKMRGNDLTTARPEFEFPGLKEGDRWCLCVSRWVEAFEAGCAPKLDLTATHVSTLEYVDLGDLEAQSI